MNLNQTIPNMRSGIVLRYDRSKGIGVIFSDNERYFFCYDRIIRGPLHPSVNDRVLFVPGKPRCNAPVWKLTPAFSIIVQTPEPGFAALAQAAAAADATLGVK